MAESPMSPASRVDFYGFLDRMRRPAAADLFRSIKSFLASLSLDEPSAEADGARVQAFFTAMETTIREHPLWANATHQEIDHALEGLEKYIMTKLFDRTFVSSAEDAAADAEVSEKIGLLQQFLRPCHLDIPKVLHNEASWLLAVKELQKINSFKSPRDKLLCIMSCCQVINNLLLNVSMSNDRSPSGADEFLPILIYITIKASFSFAPFFSFRDLAILEPIVFHVFYFNKVSITNEVREKLTQANPPQLHSNLKFVQLFRREAKLVSEVEYYLTNLISAKMFIVNVNGHSLSMEESEFQKHMESAKLGTQISAASPSTPQGLGTSTRGPQKQTDMEGSVFPYMDLETESLTAAELKQLHGLYRQVVTRYTLLSKALRKLSIDEERLLASVDDP